MNSEEKKRLRWFFTESEAVRSILAALICILIGLLIGYCVLLVINPQEATRGIFTILKNFLCFPRKEIALEYLGNTLVKTSPLLLCALSIIFAHKVGMFNIGASGQYTVGAGIALYLAIGCRMPWYVCLPAAVAGGMLFGGVAGALKVYFNVNEVISGIMLNWISLYSINMLLTEVKESATPFTIVLKNNADAALLPHWGLNRFFSGNEYVTIGILVSVIAAVGVWFVFGKMKIGYELRATGLNIDAAKYAGMNEKKNIILTMAVSGGLAALGAVCLYLSGIEQWDCGQIAVANMGFNGIAAAFLGGVHPIGAIFSSFFIQHITSGGAYINRMIYSSKMSDMIVSIIIYCCSFVFFIKYCLSKWQQQRVRSKKMSDLGQNAVKEDKA